MDSPATSGSSDGVPPTEGADSADSGTSRESAIVLLPAKRTDSGLLGKVLSYWPASSPQPAIKGSFQFYAKTLLGGKLIFNVDSESLKHDDMLAVLKRKAREELGSNVFGDAVLSMLAEIEIVPLEEYVDFRLNKTLFTPAWIIGFANLQKLTLEKHSLSVLPVEICRLPNLRELFLGGNFLRTLPPEIELVSRLITLHVQNNRIDKYPTALKGLTQLRSLWLANNLLPTVPAEVGAVQSLIGLHLQANKLAAVPVEIRNLSNLKILDLSNNWIKTVPPTTFDSLSSLTKLNLSNNKLAELTMSIGFMPQLTDLDLSHNALAMLPAELGRLTLLACLNLSCNVLAALPSSLGQLESLTELSVCGNKLLASLPPELAALTRLCRLDLTECKLQALPPELCALTSLLSLKAGSNALAGASLNSIRLPALREVQLPANQIATLPDELVLPSLTELNLSSNKLRQLPDSIGSLVALTSLNLADNCLQELPPAIGNLVELRTLKLHSNKDLVMLPWSLLQMTGLSELTLANQDISDLRKEVIELKKDPEMTSQFFTLTKSCPHHLTLFALAKFASQSSFHEKFEEHAFLRQLMDLVLSDDPRVQLHAIGAVNSLSEVDVFQSLLWSVGAFVVLMYLARKGPLDARLLALNTIGNMAFNVENRKQIFESDGLLYFRELLESDENADVRRKARRILAIFGVLRDRGHSGGIRVLSLDGGGIRFAMRSSLHRAAGFALWPRVGLGCAALLGVPTPRTRARKWCWAGLVRSA
eukprot:TRINITY_DN22807_c0_g1_i1.p1 TRINITY_DN22807_c0_g1~~TRINITY_DN22807_c0_g1_i1.p1  ORF type:complete len:763 (+),score=259.62 TRINITY_DN22807_c0_g1_i1:79-2367(+)